MAIEGYIKSVKIHNFQSHEDSFLEFHPGVNIIVGPSDSGKSAIMKAMRWVTKNRPLGVKSIKSNFASDNEPINVRIDFDEGQWIERFRGGEKNCYLTPEHKHDDFIEAFRAGVPDEVERIVNIPDYNFHSQFDRLFLLEYTSGQVAEELNNVAGLDVIDDVYARISSIIKESKRDIGVVEKTISDLEEEIKQYFDLPDIVSTFEELEKKIEQREIRRKERSNILAITCVIDDLDREIEKSKKWLEIEKPLTKFYKETQELRDTIVERGKIVRVIQQLDKFEEEISDLSFFIEPLERIKSFIEYVREVKKLSQEKNIIEKLLSELEIFNEKILRCKEDINLLNDECAYWVNELEICPVCGRPI